MEASVIFEKNSKGMRFDDINHHTGQNKWLLRVKYIVRTKI